MLAHGHSRSDVLAHPGIRLRMAIVLDADLLYVAIFTPFRAKEARIFVNYPTTKP